MIQYYETEGKESCLRQQLYRSTNKSSGDEQDRDWCLRRMQQMMLCILSTPAQPAVRGKPVCPLLWINSRCIAVQSNIKNIFYSVAPSQATRGPEFYESQSVLWNLFGKGSDFFWACDATQQKDALCSQEAFQSFNKPREYSSVQISASTELTGTGNAPHSLILFIYLFIFSWISPYSLSCHVHVVFYKDQRFPAQQPLPFGWWGAASFALQRIPSGTEQGLP